MSTVIIYFIGLIAHLNIAATGSDPERQVVALVKAPAHVVEIVVDSVAVLPSFKSFTLLKTDPAGRNHYSIDQEVVHILGISADPSQPATSDFDTEVISLKKATGQTALLGSVSNEDLSGPAAAFLELTGGQLDVAAYYPNMGNHSKVGSDQCVPSVVGYTTRSGSAVIEFVSEKGKHLRIKAGTPIWIANLPKSVGGDEHFEAYAGLITGASGGAGNWVKKTACTSLKHPIFDPTGISGKGADIDCTNSHFP